MWGGFTWRQRTVMYVEKATYFGKFCYLNSSCIRKSITLLFMSSSRNSLRRQPTLGDATTGFPAKWRLRNERRNSILMTRHYTDLGSASDWSRRVRNFIQPSRSTTQIRVVTRHQYGIAALVSETSFGRETSGSFAKCPLLSQATRGINSRFCSKTRRKMFLLVSVHHVGAHPGGYQHGVFKQISINLGKTFSSYISYTKYFLTWILAKVFVYFLPFISQILFHFFDFYFDLFWIAWHWKPLILSI